PEDANFDVASTHINLVLIEVEQAQQKVLDHLGVEVATTEEVDAATSRLTGEGLDTLTEDDTTCCYAVQDKVWVHGPGAEPWEIYTVTGDVPAGGHSAMHTLHVSPGDVA